MKSREEHPWGQGRPDSGAPQLLSRARAATLPLVLLPLTLLVLAVVLSLPATAHPAFAGEGSATGADTLDLDAYTGKVVYLDFWASWCVPCLKSFPWMQSMHRKYSDKGLAVVAVNVDRDPEAAEAFLNKHPVDFRIVFDTHAELARRYQLDAMPTSFLYGRDGTRVSAHQGFWEKDTGEIETSIRELLKQGTPP